MSDPAAAQGSLTSALPGSSHTANGSNVWGLASPLSLLLEEEIHGDLQAHEALFLTFTANLGFFERFALGVARACGARVTIVSDPAMLRADPRASRAAGRTYLSGHAACSGAFHPKLVVIAGPQRATVAVGSGNTTPDGWQDNAELWTVLRGDLTTCPTALGGVADWLAALDQQVAMAPSTIDACHRTATQLRQLTAATARMIDSEIQLVSSTAGPILESLPVGPVDTLSVCAPFHDPGAVALRAVIDRLRPSRLSISYQPHLTRLDHQALTLLTDQLVKTGTAVTISADAELHRYRHGKLIEWTIGDRRWALTGSPNLSSSALCRSVAAHGNCELGIIAPVADSLMPEGTHTPIADVAVLPISTQRDIIRPGPTVLGASRDSDGLLITLARPLPVPGTVHVSLHDAPPELTPGQLAAFPAGQASMRLSLAVPGGSRIWVTQGSGDTALISNTVTVFDPDTANVRTTAAGDMPQPRTQPADLFTDTRLAERFLVDMTALVGQHPPHGRTAQAHPSASTTTVTARAPNRGWQDYLDLCAGRIGQPLLRFALGLASLDSHLAPPSPVAPDDTSVDWDDDVVPEDQVGLDDDTTEQTDQTDAVSTAVSEQIPNLSRQPAHVRRAYQQYAARLLRLKPDDTISRLLVTRLVLWTNATGAWLPADISGLRLLSDAIRQLATITPDNEQAETAAASLAAVALSVLRSEAPPSAPDERGLLFRPAADAAAHLLPAADVAFSTEYGRLLRSAYGPAVHMDTVMDRAAEIVQADVLAESIIALTDHGRDVIRVGPRLMHVTGAFPNPALVALQAVGEAENASPVGAWAVNTQRRWALCLWNKPDLHLIEGANEPNRWRHYRFEGLAGPKAAASQREIPARSLLSRGPHNQPGPLVHQALSTVGLTDPMPPSSPAP